MVGPPLKRGPALILGSPQNAGTRLHGDFRMAHLRIRHNSIRSARCPRSEVQRARPHVSRRRQASDIRPGVLSYGSGCRGPGRLAPSHLHRALGDAGGADRAELNCRPHPGSRRSWRILGSPGNHRTRRIRYARGRCMGNCLDVWPRGVTPGLAVPAPGFGPAARPPGASVLPAPVPGLRAALAHR